MHQSLAREAWTKESGQLPLELDTQRGALLSAVLVVILVGAL